MHSSGSMLYTVLERVRALLDDPNVDAKYDDDWVVRHLVMPAVVDIHARLNLTMENPILLRYTLPLVDGTEYYHLPPCIQEIWRIAIRNAETGVVTLDWKPTGEYHPQGPGWAIEGNVLAVRPIPSENDTDFSIWYTSNGDVGIHYATTGVVSNSTTVVLASSPTIGFLDKRNNAYAGQMLRVLGTNITEEVIIESYVASTRTATLRTPITLTGTVTYEIVPAGQSQALWEAYAYAVAIKFAAIKRPSGPHFEMLKTNYNSALKTISDNLSLMNMRNPRHVDKMTVDNDQRIWRGF